MALNCAAGELNIHFRTLSGECPPGARGRCALCSKNTGSAPGIVRQGQQEAHRRACPHAGTHAAHSGGRCTWETEPLPGASSVVRTNGTLAVGFSIVTSLPNV